MKSDIDIKRDVEEELRLNPDLDATDIAVAVKSGVVTLSGFVRSYSQRWEAERTVKRVNGVTGVANDIEVRLPVFNQRPDPEIARDAVSAVQAELPVFLRAYPRHRPRWLADAGRPGRVELREGAGGTCRSARARGQGGDQPHPGQPARPASGG